MAFQLGWLSNGSATGPSLGAHGGQWNGQSGTGSALGNNNPMIVTGLTTQASGSTYLGFVGGELAKCGALSDSSSNSYGAALQTSTGYGGAFPGYGFGCYGKTNAAGGSGFSVQFTKNVTGDEATIMFCEVKNAGTIQASTISFVAGAGAGVPITSNSVTATGPALLVAMWAGDGGTGLSDLGVAVENGWTLIEYTAITGSTQVQSALAVKSVSAGTHTCSWTPIANQGAILFLAAVQA